MNSNNLSLSLIIISSSSLYAMQDALDKTHTTFKVIKMMLDTYGFLYPKPEQLFNAASNGDNWEITKLTANKFIASGLNVNQKDDNGKQPLHMQQKINDSEQSVILKN